jgi:signal transduction histidine kinase
MPNVITKRLDSQTREVWEIDKYLWLSLAYALVYIFIAQARNLLLTPIWVPWALLGLAVANGAARSFVRYRHEVTPNHILWTKVFTAADVVLISCGIVVTGGLRSDLWLLFFMAVLSESLYTGPVQTAIVATGIAVSYVAATLPAQIWIHKLEWLEFSTTLATRIFFLIIVGTYGRIISYTAEEKNRELFLLHEQMATGEERARIAREIHDGLGHALVAIILRLELCARLLNRSPEEAEIILREEIPTLRSAWNQGRDLAFHLRPWETEVTTPGGLPETLRLQIARFADRTGLNIAFDNEGACPRLRAAVAYGLTRMVQEALTNAVKHAEASRMEVSLRFPERDKLVCVITDDGKGFTPDAERGGFGLQAIRERAEALGGKIELSSAPGAGTRIAITLPT